MKEMVWGLFANGAKKIAENIDPSQLVQSGKNFLHHDISGEIQAKTTQKSMTINFEQLNVLALEELIVVSTNMCSKIFNAYTGGYFRQDDVTKELLALLKKPKSDSTEAHYVVALTQKVIERLKDKGGHMGEVLWHFHMCETPGGLFTPTAKFIRLYNQLKEKESDVPSMDNLFSEIIFYDGLKRYPNVFLKGSKSSKEFEEEKAPDRHEHTPGR